MYQTRKYQNSNLRRKIIEKGPGTRPNHCKIVFIFRSPLETFLWIRACSCMYTSCVTRIFNVTKKQIINTGMCWYIPFTRRPYFYLLQHCLDFLTGGTARFTLVHIPLDPVVTFPPLPMPDRDGPALFSNKYLLLPIRPIIQIYYQYAQRMVNSISYLYQL